MKVSKIGKVRYSEAFKTHVVRDIEDNGLGVYQARLKYGIGGGGTVRAWTLQYGNGQHGKVIRVEHPDERKELNRLKKELQKAKEALADAHIDLLLERAFLDKACKRLGEDVAGFKKKAGGK